MKTFYQEHTIRTEYTLVKVPVEAASVLSEPTDEDFRKMGYVPEQLLDDAKRSNFAALKEEYRTILRDACAVFPTDVDIRNLPEAIRGLRTEVSQAQADARRAAANVGEITRDSREAERRMREAEEAKEAMLARLQAAEERSADIRHAVIRLCVWLSLAKVSEIESKPIGELEEVFRKGVEERLGKVFQRARDAEAIIAGAREACPIVRMQEFGGLDLIPLIQAQVRHDEDYQRTLLAGNAELRTQLRATEQLVSETKAKAAKAQRALDDTAKSIGEQLSKRGFECEPEREKYTTIRVEDALDQLMHERDTAMAQAERVQAETSCLRSKLEDVRKQRDDEVTALTQAQDVLRAKLGEAETILTGSDRLTREAFAVLSRLSSWLGSGMGEAGTTAAEYEARIRDGVKHLQASDSDRLTRYAALERAAREWRKSPGCAQIAELGKAVDALTPAAGADPSPSKPETCGECSAYADGCHSRKGIAHRGATVSSADTACPHFTRRPVATCGECEDRATSRCPVPGRDVAAATPASCFRRLPVVAAARYAPCDDCCYDDGEGGCINADGDTANAACDAYKQEVVSAPRPAAQAEEPEKS